MKAFIVDNTIVEILVPTAGFSITDCYHGDILDRCIDTPANAQVGWVLNEEGDWVAPSAPPRRWSKDDIRASLTLAEKVKWDNDSAPEIVTVKKELETPATEEVLTPLLEFLVSTKVIAQSTMTAILA